jgi:hypothetical protein
LRSAWEEQRRFPLKLATTLSQQFANRGLQFFKVNRTVTHVSVARPRYLDMEATPVSLGVRQIVDLINATTKCTRRKLIEALAPSAPPPAPAPPPEAAAGAAPATAAGTPSGPAPAPEASPEQTAVASDLHWLIHEGHVIEFANGVLETAKKPFIKPPKPESKPATPAPAKEPAPGGDAVAAPETAVLAAGSEAPVPTAAGEAPAAAPGGDTAFNAAPEAQSALSALVPPGGTTAEIRNPQLAAPARPAKASGDGGSPSEGGSAIPIPAPVEPPPEPSAVPQTEGLAASSLNAP